MGCVGSKKENIQSTKSALNKKSTPSRKSTPSCLPGNQQWNSDDSIESINPEDNPVFNSRQIILLGPEFLSKLSKTKVLIIGLQGLGVEIAKNLILLGPNKVTLFDNEITTSRDLGTNYALRESHVGSLSRAKGSEPVLKKLNDHVDVEIATTLNDQLILNCNLVIMTVFDTQKISHISSLCHQNGIGFILAGLLGPLAFSFIDYGSNFEILDSDGKSPSIHNITSITKSKHGIVTFSEPCILLQEGQSLRFEDVQGMTELNDPTREIKIIREISENSFEIGDTSKFGKYTGGGFALSIKQKINMQFKELNESLTNPDIHERYAGCSRVEASKLHKIFHSIFSFHSSNRFLPKILDESDYEACKSIFSELFSSPVESEGEEFVDAFKKTCLFSQIHLNALATLWGGIVAFDAFKYTGKYRPPFQWSYYDFSEYIQLDKSRELTEDRYFDERVLFGDEAIRKLQSFSSFVVGAGALGCEIMKCYALTGVGTRGSGKTYLTDDDSIEHSNLNRQFLFNKENIGMSKSECAMKAALAINPNCKVENYALRCNEENSSTFNELFWGSLDFILPAVDTVDSRNYIDSKVLKHDKYVFNTGISGLVGNSEVYIPYFTPSFSDYGRVDDIKEWKPSCTLKYIPIKFEHCIEWGRTVFQKLFIDEIIDINKLLENLSAYDENIQKTALENLSFAISTYQSRDIELIFKKIAAKKLKELSQTEITDLMHDYPIDRAENNVKFWNPSKTIPTPLEVSPSSRLGKKFIKSYVEILSKIYGKQFNISNEIPQDIENFAISLPKNLLESVHNSCQDETPVFTPEVFDKDNDSHINFIYACAYIRAKCFKIKRLGIFKTKEIAGNIAQTIASVSAAITGEQMLEIFKYASDLPPASFKSLNFSLMSDMIFYYEQGEPKRNEENKIMLTEEQELIRLPRSATSWDKQEIREQFTIGKFIDHFHENFGIKINFIFYNGNIIFYSEKYEQRYKEKALGQTIEKRFTEVMEEEIKPDMQYFFLSVTGKVMHEGAEKSAEIRNIKYFINH